MIDFKLVLQSCFKDLTNQSFRLMLLYWLVFDVLGWFGDIMERLRFGYCFLSLYIFRGAYKCIIFFMLETIFFNNFHRSVGLICHGLIHINKGFFLLFTFLSKCSFELLIMIIGIMR